MALRQVTKPIYPDADRPTTFEEGLEFQDFVVDLLLKELGVCLSNYSSKYYQFNFGENRQGFEIKLDRRISETGNVSIEIGEKAKADNDLWVPSGIMTKSNAWLYIQGNYDIIFIFPRKYLQLLYAARYRDKAWTPKPTIMTFLMPIADARKYAAKVIQTNPLPCERMKITGWKLTDDERIEHQLWDCR